MWSRHSGRSFQDPARKESRCSFRMLPDPALQRSIPAPARRESRCSFRMLPDPALQRSIPAPARRESRCSFRFLRQAGLLRSSHLPVRPLQSHERPAALLRIFDPAWQSSRIHLYPDRPAPPWPDLQMLPGPDLHQPQADCPHPWARHSRPPRIRQIHPDRHLKSVYQTDSTLPSFLPPHSFFSQNCRLSVSFRIMRPGRRR